MKSLKLPLFIVSILLATSLAKSPPVKRSYHSHDYYVLQLRSGSNPEEVLRNLFPVEVELVERVGELNDHWLVRAEKSWVTGESHEEFQKRVIEEGDYQEEKKKKKKKRDRVLEHFRSIKKQRRIEKPLGLEGRSSISSSSSIISLSPQIPKRLVKRLPAPPPPETSNKGPPPETEASLYAKQFHIQDPIFNEQWHVINNDYKENMINVTGVWEEGVTGKGVTVAMVDDGVDVNSFDLKDNFRASSSWDYNDNNPLPIPRLSDDFHGTRCAGEISAAKNLVCGVGVAHESSIAGIRILSGVITSADEASGLNYAYQENDIYSCSWGPRDDGRTVEAPEHLVKKALLNGVQNGRGGKGNIYVFASGNGGASE
jgi:kexin